MDDNFVIIFHAGFDEWKKAAKILADIGWFIAEEDFHRFYNGFGKNNFNFTIVLEKDTDIFVGCISTGFYESVNNSPSLVTLGHYIISPEFQGKGIGTKLFKAALRDPRFLDANFGLNGTAQLTKKYAEKFGYDKFPNWQICKSKIKVADINISALNVEPEIDVVDFKDINYQELVNYDTKIQGGIRRDKFLMAFLDSKINYAKFAINKHGKIIGFGNIRPSLNNHLGLGILYADSKEIAETLLKHILESIENLHNYDYLRIFSPTTNKHADEIMTKLSNGKMETSPGLCFPQFTKEVIHVDTLRIFSITEYDLNMA